MTSVRIFVFSILISSIACSEMSVLDKIRVNEVDTIAKETKFSDTDAGFEISISGKEMYPDADSYNRLMRTIGSLVTDQTLAKFVRTARGFEGGGTYCIELEKYRDMQKRMSRVHTLLIEISPPENTLYEIKLVASCASAQVGP